MSSREHHLHIIEQPWDLWLARGAVAVIIALQLAVINDFALGPKWAMPILEGLLLIALSVATAWTIDKAKAGTENQHFIEVAKFRAWIRTAAIWLTALITLSNFAALFELVRALLTGKAGGGTSLLLDAINIWSTNVIAFALWFWSLDRGGPTLRGLHKSPDRDFLFPQMSMKGPEVKEWVPGFIDYMFIAFTNATAFSPTDTLPLTQRIKLLMMAQSGTSLLVVALVAARAVNILN